MPDYLGTAMTRKIITVQVKGRKPPLFSPCALQSKGRGPHSVDAWWAADTTYIAPLTFRVLQPEIPAA